MRYEDSKLHPEYRFTQRTTWGPVPEHAPELGPCLLMAGADNGNGYVQFRFDNRGDYGHRYAWVRVNGAIPSDLTVDHLCRVRQCCNVDHLELVPGAVNTKRATAVRTECLNGHTYNAENTHYGPKGRECKICIRETGLRGQAKRRRVSNGLPDRRLKYDQAELNAVLALVVAHQISVRDGAARIGCSVKYLDKRARQYRRAAA